MKYFFSFILVSWGQSNIRKAVLSFLILTLTLCPGAVHPGRDPDGELRAGGHGVQAAAQRPPGQHCAQVGGRPADDGRRQRLGQPSCSDDAAAGPSAPVQLYNWPSAPAEMYNWPNTPVHCHRAARLYPVHPSSSTVLCPWQWYPHPPTTSGGAGGVPLRQYSTPCSFRLRGQPPTGHLPVRPTPCLAIAPGVSRVSCRGGPHLALRPATPSLYRAFYSLALANPALATVVNPGQL